MPEAKVKLFADDTNLFIFGKSFQEISATTNNLLRNLNEWFVANKLSLNIEKTSYSSFSNRMPQHDINLSINTTEIKRCEHVKYLGVWIDQNLTWKQHIDHIYSKIVKFVGIFYKLAYKLPDDCLKMLYFAFVYPHLLYGIEIYANTFPTYLDRLKKLNNKILRILQHIGRFCRNSELYIKYNTLPISELHQSQIICLAHKFIYHRGSLPKIYHTYFTENFKIHQHDTRTKNCLHLTSVSCNRGKRAINFKGCLLWNSLPDDLKSISSIPAFKKHLKDFLLHNNLT